MKTVTNIEFNFNAKETKVAGFNMFDRGIDELSNRGKYIM